MSTLMSVGQEHCCTTTVVAVSARWRCYYSATHALALAPCWIDGSTQGRHERGDGVRDAGQRRIVMVSGFFLHAHTGPSHRGSNAPRLRLSKLAFVPSGVPCASHSRCLPRRSENWSYSCRRWHPPAAVCYCHCRVSLHIPFSPSYRARL